MTGGIVVTSDKKEPLDVSLEIHGITEKELGKDNKENKEDETETKWKDMSCGQKCRSVTIVFWKLVFLFGFLYLFICSLGFLSDAFKLVGGKVAGQTFRENNLLNNPIAGLMIGVLATVLLQSSSTTTSIIITMVGAKIIPIKTAIPMVMGANVGTSVTNTIVSFAQSGDREEFRRAFAGATVHDMFNWLGVIILLPVEVISHYLYYLTGAIVDSLDLTTTSGHDQEMLEKITKPFTDLVVKVNKDVITDIAVRKQGAEDASVLKRWCKFEVVPYNGTVSHTETFNQTSQEFINKTSLLTASGINFTSLVNGTNATLEWSEIGTLYTHVHVGRCKNLFAQTDLDDNVLGIILLVVSLFLIVFCLIVIVKILNSLLKGSVAKVVKKTINADFPGKFAFLTGYVAILVGTGMTMIIQSSSVFTSTLTPLVGVGVVNLERMYPLTIGANIGTTLTGILVALAASANELKSSLHIALCHVFFNATAVLIFYPVPFMRKAPIKLAKILGNTTSKYRWFSVFYLLFMFFILPGAVFGLSVAGGVVLMAVGIPLLAILIIVIVINICQRKCGNCLPKPLRNWNCLPKPFHSLRPYDRVLSKVISICPCKKCKEDTVVFKPEGGNINTAYESTEHL